MKTSLKKNEVALLQTLSRLFYLVQFVKCWQFFLELNSKRLYRSSEKEESRCLVYTSSTKRSIRHFHVVVVQWRQRNVQKSVMHVQSCCLANRNLLLSFMPFSLTSPSSLLKRPNRDRVNEVSPTPVTARIFLGISGINLFFPFSLHCFRMRQISFSVLIWNAMHFTR